MFPTIQVGSRVAFVGPEYKHGADGPTIGQHGTVTKRDGHHAHPLGGLREEMILVHFDGADKDTYVGIHRVRLSDGPTSPDPGSPDDKCPKCGTVRTVYLVYLFVLPQTPDEWRAAPKIEYTTPEAVVADGWIVD